MPLRKLEQQRRLAVCTLMIELMRPTEGTAEFSVTDTLVLCAVVVSTFGPHPLSAQKIADTTGLALTCVRRAVKKLTAAGRIERVGHHHVVAPAYHASVAGLYDLKRKGLAIRRTATRLLELSGRAPIRRPNALDPAKFPSDTEHTAQIEGSPKA